jgi:signal transduction histidine kinase/DNA-binding NarL/FixJ family response regulator
VKGGSGRLLAVGLLALCGVVALAVATSSAERSSSIELAETRTRLTMLHARLDRELATERPASQALIDSLADLRSVHAGLAASLEPLPGNCDEELERHLSDFRAALDDATDRTEQYAMSAACLQQGVQRLSHTIAEYRSRSITADSEEGMQLAFERMGYQVELYALGVQNRLPEKVLADLDVLRHGRGRVDPERRDALDRVLTHVSACRLHDADAREHLAAVRTARLGSVGAALEHACGDYIRARAAVLDVVRAVGIVIALTILLTLLYSAIRLEMRADVRAVEQPSAERRKRLLAERAEFVLELDRSRRAELEAQAARDLAEAKSAAKSDFVALMSHEIRTPMTSILGYSDRLREADIPERERTEAVEMLRQSGEYLLQLVNDMLDLSKIEAGRLEIERAPCALFDVLFEVRASMEVRARAKGLGFELQFATAMPDTIVTDAIRLKQILLNLIGNAIKFTDAGSVRVTFELCESEGAPAYFRIAVADTGVGMSDEEMSRLFQPFVQAGRSTARRFGGTGLGLSIAKTLVELLNGTIRVESHPGEGSTFVAEIEIGTPESVNYIASDELERLARHEAFDDVTHALPKLSCRVLVVDDSPDHRRLVSHLLGRAGAEVALAENGHAALQRVLQGKVAGRAFDLILMDVNMPVLDGRAATQRLRSLGYTLPIIALTADSSGADARRALDAGCNAVCVKPVDAVALIETVSKHVKHETPMDTKRDTKRSLSGVPGDLAAADDELNRLVQMFLDDLARDAQDMQSAFVADDLDSVARLAHRLKGTAGSYGFPALTEQAARLERSARAKGAHADVQRELATLKELCAAARNPS